MQIPPAGLIEAAADELKAMHVSAAEELARQRRELAEGSPMLTVSAEGLAFAAGYELGLQTARVMIRTSPAIQRAGLEEIL